MTWSRAHRLCVLAHPPENGCLPMWMAVLCGSHPATCQPAVSIAEGASHRHSPAAPLSPHHVCSTLLSTACLLEMRKEQWLFSFVQDSILHTRFPFFNSQINVPSPSSFWLAISNLLVCLLRGACSIFVLRLSYGCHSENGAFIWFFMGLVLINYPSVICY